MSSRGGPKLHHAKFSWSDVTSWNGLDKRVMEPARKERQTDEDKLRWFDFWGVYDETCMLIARHWLGSSGPPANNNSLKHSFRDTVLNSFRWRTSFLLSTLENVTSDVQAPDSSTITLTPAVLSAFELGPYSSSDARFVEWLAERNGRKIEIRQSWRDWLWIALGIN